jgi:amidase
MVARYAERYDQHKDEMTPALKNQVEAAFQVDVRTIARGEKMRAHYWRRIAAFLGKYDYILAPTCGAPPFRLDQPLPDQINGTKVARFYDVFLTTYAFNITGLPTVAMPCGARRRPRGRLAGSQLRGRLRPRIRNMRSYAPDFSSVSIA